MRQMYIDLGQTKFNEKTLCSHCNFFYLVGDYSDEKEHKKYCAAMGQAVPYKVTKSNEPKKIHCFDKWADVVEFHPSAMKVDKCLKIVASQMKDDFGFDVNTVSDDSETLHLYVYLDKGNILGVLFFERVDRCTTKIVSDQVAPTDVCIEKKQSDFIPRSEINAPPSSVVPSSDSVEIGPQNSSSDQLTLGVRYIWVHKKWRRKGIASSLCDVARRNAEYGRVVKRSAISFSQPTSHGMDFAISYTQSSSVLAYG